MILRYSAVNKERNEKWNFPVLRIKLTRTQENRPLEICPLGIAMFECMGHTYT